MDGFLTWFFAFITEMIGGLWKIIYGIGSGIVQIFNIPAYISQFQLYSKTFTIADWVVSVLAFIFVFAIWGIIFAMLLMVIRKYISFIIKVSQHKTRC